MSKVWLVTGSGSGLGREIAIKALEAGHRVVATARDVNQLDDLVSVIWFSRKTGPSRCYR